MKFLRMQGGRARFARFGKAEMRGRQRLCRCRRPVPQSGAGRARPVGESALSEGGAMLRSSIAPCGVRTIIPSAAFCQVWTLDRKLKAAATADEGTRAVARRRFLPCVSPLTRRSLLICSSFSHNRGFQLALTSRTFLNAAIHTNSAVSAPARRAVFGFAEYGRRRLSPPPLSRCPLRGQRGAAHSGIFR